MQSRTITDPGGWERDRAAAILRAAVLCPSPNPAVSTQITGSMGAEKNQVYKNKMLASLPNNLKY
jgi:hypothetical protein